ncbi:glycosyltransferase [Actinokineospora sp. NBRC 105648]|uniref:glycosyltransferase n=1 Tax=Actinokineospora sp. NBRC 105648 TaxID=3032206 RepID=UPI0024A33226|nr:glycosyltransferase [Actinokineospora sp. NBRC 105648]GLZ41276.1 hypothetical protein Acsp05_49000 [Actinokineospora sp. NBRC 105648]
MTDGAPELRIERAPAPEGTLASHLHRHRYALAAGLSAGKRVLDLGCGRGAGAAVLAEHAAEVVGVDADRSLVDAARSAHRRSNLRFESGSVGDTGLLADHGTFDVITCFGAAGERDRLLRVVRGWLAEDGLLLVDVEGLSKAAFTELLTDRFAAVAVLRQAAAVGSVIASADRDTVGGAVGRTLRRDGQEWTVEADLPWEYTIVAASNVDLPVFPSVDLLVDPECSPVAGAETDRLRDELTRVATTLAHEARTASRQAARIEWLSSSLAEMERRAVRAERQVSQLSEEVQKQSALIQRALGRYRHTVERVAPRGTLRRDVYERALGRTAGVPAPAPAELSPVAVHTDESPLVSVIIPTYGKWSYTRQCLLTLAAANSTVPFEVIVVDDASPDDAADQVARCPGVRLVRAERNRGFIGACNLGAEHARSDLLVFLNNDTEVRPGWLDELYETMTSDDRIGLVGAKLVYPDGSLQECGGIIWSDATGWNYGRGGDPGEPAVNVTRDVDYCSGAAIMVRRDLFEQVGGFDTRYAPAYYEDTDLAFAIRASGHRVVVQPNSVVVHHEGVSHGTDIAQGVKRHQELNRVVFAQKWADELARQRPEPTPANLWLASRRDPLDRDGGLVLVMDHKIPTPDQDAGSIRIYRLIEELLALGCRVVYFPADYAETQPYTADLRRKGVTVLSDPGRQQTFVREVGPELALVLLARPSVAWLLLEQLREHAPQCTIAYDTVDLHFLRLERQAALAEQEGELAEALGLRRKADASRELELGLMRACDLSLVVSPVELELLAKLVPEADVRILSLVQDVDWAPSSPDGRAGVLFVGGYDHLPNRDAAAWLAEEIMPLVRRERPGTVLHLVGSRPTREVLDLASEHVEVHGFVHDLTSLYARARVVAAPLRFGAGVKGKIAESAALGVPTVATTIGAEGMNLTPEQDILVGDDAEELAAAIIRLLDDDRLWLRLSAGGKIKVDEVFGRAVARRFLEGVLAGH